ncbi:MAG: hypothetical protein ACYDCL_04055 [Myxococcales bacterium]
MDAREGQSHRARKRLFAQGLRRRYVTVDEIENALPSGSLTAAERWLLYYSLRAAGVEIRGELPLPGGRLPIVERDSH